MVGSKFILLFIMFFAVGSNGMEVSQEQANSQEIGLCLTEDILQNAVRPYLTLQTIARFAQTSKKYAHIFEPGKIDICMPCLKKIEEDYYRCTHALGRFAQYENETMFEKMWTFDAEMRNKNVALLEQKSDLNRCDKMNVYRKYYGNLEDVDKNIAEQLRVAITDDDVNAIDAIIEHKKYNIFNLFKNDETLEIAFQALCSGVTRGYTNADTILALLPVENGEHKNLAIQYIAKYDELSILLALLKKGYLKVHEEYGNKCTLLHYAAVRGCRRLTGILLKQGVDMHVVNTWGKQPLYYAYLFYREHKDFGPYKYLFRGEGVEEWLRTWCYDKHVRLGKRTEHCLDPQSYLELSEEEKDWLRNSCTYSLEK